jgi:iron complex outermembrane receptor protein
MEVGQFDATFSMGVGFKQASDTLLDWNAEEGIAEERTYTTGERMIYQPEIRIAGRPSEKFGYKISGQFLSGNDWVTYDPREPAIGTEMVTGSIRDGQPFSVDTSIATFPFERDFAVRKIGGDVRLDYAPSDDLNIILNGGFTQASNLELTGLGAGQAVDWQYAYGQIRVNYKNLFVQYFINTTDANETFLIPQNPDDNRIQQLIDKSQQHVFSIQHTSRPVDKLNLIYGIDVLLTRPNTEGTINGRFEDADNVNQAGVYVQGEYKASDKWKFVAATRVDYHDPLEEFQVSPRAAIVYKPAPKHTVRGTYNRAFSTPTTLNLALDLANGVIPNGIAVRGIGNAAGYFYSRDDVGNPLMVNPYNNMLYNPQVNGNNGLFWGQFQDALGLLVAEGAGLTAPFLINQIQDLFGDVFTGMGTSAQGIDLVGFDYAAVASAPDGADPNQALFDNLFDLSSLEDFGPVESSITQTLEVGYKGLLANDKLFFNVDGYMTMIDNFVTPLTNVAPSIAFNPLQLAAALGPNEAGGLLHDNLAALPAADFGFLVGSLDGFGGGAVDGDIYEEFLILAVGGNSQLTLGTVSPDNQDSLVGADAILTYRNLDERVTVFGADLGFTYLVGKNGALSGSFSWVNRDSIAVEGAAGGYIALNAPRYKFSTGYDHEFPEIGLSIGGSVRWNDGFPANSAVYIGRVDPYHVVDARVAYTPSFSENSKILLDISNVLGRPYQTFPGVPQIGRVTFLKLQHTF